ncbi:hypothetical protein BJP39_09285 [Streptomyces sp. CC77]|uniref:hypothetical protein n=1 Tax=Streptomyces sp. CC210A TaxID=2898184 RepID=UPI0008DE5B66|nr:hypothetical protein [Streptomyces sp. CC210A]OII65310.1 hypothetical protein BJP39_09285 [Streptomyces sp. CC77]
MGLGLLLVLVAGVLFVVVSDVLSDQRAYVAAPACPGVTRGDSCTTTVPATVVGREDVPSGKSVHHWLRLTERGSHTVQRVRMAGSGPVYGAVRAGDEVQVTYWRGEIHTVRFGAAAQVSWSSPANAWRFPMGFALMLLPWGLSMLWAGWWFRRRSAAAASMAPWQVSTWFMGGVTLGCVGLVASMTAGGARDAALVTAVGMVPSATVGGLFGWWLLRREKRAADTSGILPVPPTERRCVDAAVHGDVSYSVDGFDHLVVGDGPVSATPDPAGRVARRALPETLTVQRLRSLRPQDPAGWYRAFGHDCVVIECRDGDHTVLIATRRRQAPVVLGALLAASTG